MGGKQKKASAGNHKALYRKHRSRSFDEVKGQSHITRTLKNAVEAGKISHAYLFTGPRGVGKTSIARIFAHEINQLPYEGETTNLDIIEIDAASNRRIDDIRDLRDKVHIAPVSARYKVYIIDEVHMLTTESFNALLKTLEEPPAHVIFILATTEVHKLPATIISRTQRHHFRSIPQEEIAAHLKELSKKEAIDVTDDALQLLAHYSGGSFRDSISLLDQLGASGEKIDAALVELMLGIASTESINGLLTAVSRGDTQIILDEIEALVDEGIAPSTIARQCIEALRAQLRQDGVLSGEKIALIDNLIDIESAVDPKLKLETTLLSYALKRNPSSAAVVSGNKGVDQSEPKSREQPKSPETKTSEHKVPSETEAISDGTLKKSPEVKVEEGGKSEAVETSGKITQPVEEWWPKLLEEVKIKNNPLYTILRLAQPQLLSENELELAFGFEFHRKRVDDVKYRNIITLTCQEVTGAAPIVVTKLEKGLAGPQTNSIDSISPASQLDSAQASQIDHIKDMMGGGEILQHA